MQISLRSQLAAGVAAVGATALVIAPVAQPELVPIPERVSSAAVQLSAFANPVTALLNTIAYAAEDLFYQGELPELFWPPSFFGSEDFFYGPRYFGLLPDLVNQFSFGPISAVINNLSGYVDAGIYGATQVLGGAADSVWNTPFALVAAAQLALAGDVEAALAELQAQILTPLQDGITAGLQGVGYIVDNVINNVQTLIVETVPFLVAGLVDQVVGAGTFLLEEVVRFSTTIVTSLASLDFEGAWNAAVEGLLGPPGLLSSLQLLTFGIGVVQTVEEQETVVYPSLRSVLTSAAQRLGDFSSLGDGGISNDPFVPVAAAASPVAPAAVAPAAEAAAAAEVSVEAPATGASAGDDTAVADEVQVSAAEADTEAAAGAAAEVSAAEVSVAEVKAGAKAQVGPAGEASGGTAEAAGGEAATGDEAPAAPVAEAPAAPGAETGEATSAPSPERASRGAAKRAAAAR